MRFPFQRSTVYIVHVHFAGTLFYKTGQNPCFEFFAVITCIFVMAMQGSFPYCIFFLLSQIDIAKYVKLIIHREIYIRYVLQICGKVNVHGVHCRLDVTSEVLERA